MQRWYFPPNNTHFIGRSFPTIFPRHGNHVYSYSASLHQWRSHWVARGAEYHPWQREICQKSGKRGGKEGKNQKNRGKIGRKGKNREGSFTLTLLTDRAGIRYCSAWSYRWGELSSQLLSHFEDVTSLRYDFDQLQTRRCFSSRQSTYIGKNIGVHDVKFILKVGY